ncbi:MAG: hypothetical protein RLZZ282_402, partial [Verrucomicrobiota bacterium]
MVATSPPPPSSKAVVFARRSVSTLVLWALISAIFISRWSWAYLGLVGVLTLIASVEYFRMLRAAGVTCFPRLGMLLAVGYCGVLHGYLLLGKQPPLDLDASALFIAVAAAFMLQLRQPIRGLDPLLAVAANVFGFIYIAFLFNFAARLIF